MKELLKPAETFRPLFSSKTGAVLVEGTTRRGMGKLNALTSYMAPILLYSSKNCLAFHLIFGLL